MPSAKVILPRFERLSSDGRPGPSLDERKGAVTTAPPAAANSHPTGAGASATAPLGKNAKSTAAGGTCYDPVLGTVTRFALQSGAADLLRGERVAGCCRWRWRPTVEMWHLPEHQKAKLLGLQTCSSVWMCPVCATKISERRKHELEEALKAAHAAGLYVVLVTYTLRHRLSQGLSELVGHQKGKRGPDCGMMGARSLATGCRAVRKLYAESGVVGSVRALEVTHHSTHAPAEAQNGWHPHVHELLFLERDDRLGHLWQGLRREWKHALDLVGLDCDEAHGVVLAPCDADIAEYVAKFGHARSWDVEHELTKQVTKKGRASSWSPTDMLHAYTFAGDRQAGQWYTEYAHAMKGSRQLYWSRGLRDRLGLGRELSEQEICEADDGSQARLMGEVDPRQWRLIVRNDMRAQFTASGDRGDWADVRTFLDGMDPEPLGAAPDPVHEAEEILESCDEWLAGEIAAIRSSSIWEQLAGVAETWYDDPFADLDPRMIALAELLPHYCEAQLRDYLDSYDRIMERKALQKPR